MKSRGLAILLMFTIFVISKGGEVFEVVVNDAPPYRIIDNENYSGIYIDIIKEVAEEAGIELKFKEMPFKRALESMKSGEADIMLGPNKNSERNEFMYFIEECPFPREEKAFYVSDENKKIKKYDDLYNKKIEVLRGMAYFEKFDEDIRLNKVETSDYMNAILKVSKGRSDVVIIPEQQGDFLLKESRIELIKSPYLIEGNLSFVSISKKSKNFEILKSKLTKGMLIAKKKGTFKKIIKRYSNN